MTEFETLYRNLKEEIESGMELVNEDSKPEVLLLLLRAQFLIQGILADMEKMVDEELKTDALAREKYEELKKLSDASLEKLQEERKKRTTGYKIKAWIKKRLKKTERS